MKAMSIKSVLTVAVFLVGRIVRAWPKLQVSLRTVGATCHDIEPGS